MNTNIQIWYKDPKDFVLNPDTIIEIIPNKRMTLAQQLNCMMRFMLYFSIIVYLIKKDYLVIFVLIFVAIVTALIYESKFNLKNDKIEAFSKLGVSPDGTCVLPTKDNPFMNVSYLDYNDFPNRPPACNLNNKLVKEELNDILEASCFRDVDDVFSRKMNDRQFYTNPSTTIPNDQEAFAKWLYQTPPTCKEKTIVCRGNNVY